MQDTNAAPAPRRPFTKACVLVSGLLLLNIACISSAVSQSNVDNSSNPQSTPDMQSGPGTIHQSEPKVAKATGRLIIKYHAAEKPWQTPRGNKRMIRSTLRDRRKLTFERNLSETRELVKPHRVQSTRGELQAHPSKAPELKMHELKMHELKTMASNLSSQTDIEYASVEYRRYPLLQPNDPLYQGTQNPGNQSYLYDGQYSAHAPGAWDITTGSSSSVIAIVDTGVLPDHPEIANRSVTDLGYDFVSADNPNDFSSANDGDGRDANPIDPGDGCNGLSSSWHGTGVASVAAGTSNNSEGFAGIDWNARLLHARALGICGGTDADIIDAIRWSVGLSVAGIPDNPTPANVVNLSLGGATECTKAWQDVIDELTARNVVFVMAAGNESSNALRSSPANCANVITVGSSTSDGDVDSLFSNYGLKVTISTGGRDILVASNRGFDAPEPDSNFYRTENGTSFSAAIVSGAISLMHSLNPDLGPADVRAILQDSATPFANGTECDRYHCGGGVMNLARALNVVQNNSYNPERDTAQELIGNQATPIVVQREINATLFGFKDTRYFSIEIPQRGLLQAESSSGVDLYGYLLNEELSVIALDDDSSDGNDFRVASLVEPGTYYVAVERQAHRQSDGELAFSLTTSLNDDTPDAFEFPSIAAAANAIVESNTVTISGLQSESVLTISDGFYSLNEGDLDNTPATITNGDTLLVATQSPGSVDGSTTTTVSVGAYSTNFTVTTSAERALSGNTVGNSGSGCTLTPVHPSGTASIDPLLLLLLCASSIALTTRSSRSRAASR